MPYHYEQNIIQCIVIQRLLAAWVHKHQGPQGSKPKEPSQWQSFEKLVGRFKQFWHSRSGRILLTASEEANSKSNVGSLAGSPLPRVPAWTKSQAISKSQLISVTKLWQIALSQVFDQVLDQALDQVLDHLQEPNLIDKTLTLWTNTDCCSCTLFFKCPKCRRLFWMISKSVFGMQQAPK